MEMLLSLNANSIDLIKLAAFLAAFFINRQAIIIVIFHCIGEVLFMSTDSGFISSLLLASLYSVAATVNLRLSYQIRQALICVALVNWIAAIDFFVFPHETLFYLCYPWIINGLDVFILISLIGYGGWRCDRDCNASCSAGNNIRASLQLCKIRSNKV